MHDINYIRENPDSFDEALKKRGAAPESARLLAIDEKRRARINELQALQEKRNAASKEIGKAKAAPAAPIIIIGHSLGGDAALVMSNWMVHNGVPVSVDSPAGCSHPLRRAHPAAARRGR